MLHKIIISIALLSSLTQAVFAGTPSDCMNTWLDQKRAELEKQGVTIQVYYPYLTEQHYHFTARPDNPFCTVLNERGNCRWDWGTVDGRTAIGAAITDRMYYCAESRALCDFIPFYPYFKPTSIMIRCYRSPM